jgi:hypothetical protein
MSWTLNFFATRASCIAAFAVVGLVSTSAEAAPGRVAILGPDEAPIVARLQRNVASMHMEAVTATVNVCTRDVVTRLLTELRVESALCADGDAVAIWIKDGGDGRVVLKDVIVSQGSDDRTQEVTAARAAMALRQLPAKDAGGAAQKDPGALTIVANGPGATIAATDPNAVPGADTPARPLKPPPPEERITPRLVLGIGPGTATSRDGTSFAISAEAEIGVSRYVAVVPWVTFIPVNRTAERPEGTATFRPTLFGIGFGIPILKPSSFVVPRIGGGYGILWMHVSPETAVAPAQTKKPEDLLAPIIYTTAALSFAVTPSFRVVGEGLIGVSSHDMVVRIAQQSAARWGVPMANLSARAEWVLP